MVDNETVVELCHLISESNLTVKKTALEYLLGLSGSHQGLNVFVCNTKLITSLIALAHQPFNDVYDSLLLSTLINCAEIPSLCETMIEDTSFICSILNRILSKETTTDLSCKLLTNLTRFSLSVNSILNAAKQSLFALVNRYCSNDTSCEYLSLVFSNMSVNFSFTEFLFKDNCSIFNRLIAFLGHKSLVCRKGASLLIKNSVFHISLHDIIFKSNIDLISKVLMPLAGPEEYSDDENDKLPIDLQYLPSNKKREVSAEIRLTLLQSLHKLCTTELGRKCVSDCGTYLILRELEKEENEKSVLYELHKVVQILIGDHIEGNLSDVAIPSELEAEFKKMKRSAGNQLSILNWDQEDESETTPKSGIFAGFSGFKTNSKPSVNFASSVGTPNTKNPDDEQQSYLAELSSLNRSVSDWIDQHVRENACIDLTPIFADYKEHLSTIAKKYGRSLSLRNNEKSTESSPPFGDAVKSTSFTNNSSSMSNSTSNANTTINFGEANANKTSNPTTGLFGLFSNSSSTSSTSSSMTTSTSSSFNFKMTSATDADPPSSKPFAFGSLSTPFTFAKFSQSNSNTSSLLTNSTVPKVEEKNNDDAEEQPEEPLKVEFTEVQEKDAFFSIRCKLYFKRDGSYKTKGFGMLHLKKMENNKTQLLMRADTNLGNVMLNILFNPLMPYSQNGKHVNLVAVANPPFDAKCQLCNKAFPNPQESNQCEDKCQQKPDCMLLRLSSPDDAEKLIKQLDELKESK